ncbi:MAG: beta-ketoacyl synthase N-terminal-like domain-containing protein [Moraxellaceae bacterium]|nr:beta-ketoacyl synthase N-terminal-like domain-containing protein [Moraxellaceae bacterium]
MTALAIRGRGLVCASGRDIPSAVAGLRMLPAPRIETLAAGVQRPFLPIADEAHSLTDWYAQARDLVRQAVMQAIGEDMPVAAREGALLVASSSLHVGALERGEAFVPYSTGFVHKLRDWLDWRGPVHCISTACTSSIAALGAARASVSTGAVSSALVLGVELGNRLSRAGFVGMQLLSPDRARPFGLHRNGLVLGEAVAALHCVPATPGEVDWQIAGVAHIVDGDHPAGASHQALLRACREAMQMAGCDAGSIELVKVQAAGSPGNDALEAAVLQELFPSMPPLVSLKPTLGHCLGASGAAELALLCAALDAGVLPVVTDDVDPALGVRLADALAGPARRVLAIILGFGGGHAAVVLEHQP